MRALTGLVASLLLAAACTDVVTEPGVAVAIEIGPLPFPALVAGDSLRTIDGTAVPIPVRVFDGRGELIESPELTFVTIGADPPGAVDPGSGHALGLRPGELRVIALAGRLQSTVLTIPVVPRPTALEAITAVEDTLHFREFRDHERELRVRIVADTGEGPLANVRQYLVNFAIVEPPGLGANDSTQIYLVNDQRRPSVRDTTNVEGIASRRLRLPPWMPLPAPDSVVVEASAQHLDGTPIAGSPVRFMVEIVPQP